jgi:hypothetical protein
MKDPKYYLIAKSIYDRYTETSDYDNIYDFANKPIQPSDKQIIQDHLDTITSLYFDETKIPDKEWDLVLLEIKDMIGELNIK